MILRCSSLPLDTLIAHPVWLSHMSESERTCISSYVSGLSLDSELVVGRRTIIIHWATYFYEGDSNIHHTLLPGRIFLSI